MLSVIPPLCAVVLAIKFRQVYLALFLGLLSGTTILAHGNILKGIVDAVDRCVRVFENSDNTKTVLFCILIGAIVTFTQRSGGINGFIHLLSNRKLIKTRRRAQFLTISISAMIPIESSINVLISGTVSRPIFDKLRISREKLAYLCDSFSAPICTLIPVNAWGAYIARLMNEQGVDSPFKIYLMAIPMNFYALFAITLVLLLIGIKKDFFAMAKAEKRTREEGKILRDGAMPLISSEVLAIEPKKGVAYKASNMTVPILTMIIMMIVSMYITGDGNLTAGSGSTSVLWAVLSAILVAGIKYRISKIMSFNEQVNLFFKGVGGLIPIAFLVTISFALSKICLDMNTGIYVAEITHHFVSPKFFPLILFVVTGFIAFSTGTSWGTWAIMFPIGIGFVQALDLGILPIVGAMISGGVFGDHCSPISDTTIVSSMASASDHIDHVNTQLPYALIAGFFSGIMFLIVGIILY